MEGAKVLSNAESKRRILVAPLDWGLGHATRCIPLIVELLNRGVDVTLAADGRPYDLLKREFPSLHIVRLPGYDITYSQSGELVFSMLRQIPRIVGGVITEHRVLQKLIGEFDIHAVISDNRFGLFSRRVPCIYLTHQIAIRMPRSLDWISSFVLMMHKSLIRRYDECWIPDFAGEENLSGGLSHGFPLPTNTRFIGPLSRLTTSTGSTAQYDVVAVLSGPEPQRTIFEDVIIEELKRIRCKSLVVRGVPERHQHMKLSDTLTVISFLEAEPLGKAMQSASLIVARPGYSTIMDLAAIGKPAILVPTPGQTEQEYLAGELKRKGLFCVRQQHKFDLAEAMAEAKRANGFAKSASTANLLTESIEHLIAMTNNERPNARL